MKPNSIIFTIILFATFSVTYFSACLKSDSHSHFHNSSSYTLTKQSGTANENKTPDSSIANQLITDYSTYNMQYLNQNQITGIQSMRTFYSYDSAKNYIDSFINVLSTTSSSANGLNSNVMKSNSPNVQAPDCSHGGLFHTVFGSSASAGLLSHFEAYINTTASGITNMNIYVTGTPIGWSWNQLVQNNNGYSGCTGGQLPLALPLVA